jgi:hypothetical protein
LESPINNTAKAPIAIDIDGNGMARAAIRETLHFVETKTRPWADSDVKYAREDPFIISAIGDLRIRLFAAETGIEKAARRLGETPAAPSEDEVARASIEVAAVEVVTTELAFRNQQAVRASRRQRNAGIYNLDRHCRNARTHKLRDLDRWKYMLIGDYYVNSVNPRRHSYI